MVTCQACSTEIASQDRFCRKCGAPAATSVADLVDTYRFNSTVPPVATAQPESHDSTNPFSVPPSDAYTPPPGSVPSYQTGSISKKRIQRKTLWLVIFPVTFLLLSLLIGTGAIIGRSMIRSRRAEQAAQTARAAVIARRAEQISRAEQARQARQAEVARHAFGEDFQRALGFVPASISGTEYPGIQGIFVDSLTSDNGPAALAKIQAGDVLVEMGGQAVHQDSHLAQILGTLRPGMDVPVKLYRDGETVASRIKIAYPNFQPKTEPKDQGFLGVGDVSRRCCIPGTQKWGLEVRRIIANSPADLFGLQLGDVITEIDKHVVRTPNEFSRRIHDAKPRSKVKVKFYRGNTERTVELLMGHGW